MPWSDAMAKSRARKLFDELSPIVLPQFDGFSRSFWGAQRTLFRNCLVSGHELSWTISAGPWYASQSNRLVVTLVSPLYFKVQFHTVGQSAVHLTVYSQDLSASGLAAAIGLICVELEKLDAPRAGWFRGKVRPVIWRWWAASFSGGSPAALAAGKQVHGVPGTGRLSSFF